MTEKETCRKCGTARNRSFHQWFNGREFIVKWIPLKTSGDREGPAELEHLKITCPVCGYSWNEAISENN